MIFERPARKANDLITDFISEIIPLLSTVSCRAERETAVGEDDDYMHIKNDYSKDIG